MRSFRRPRHIALRDASRCFTRLVDQAARGRSFVITRAGKPLARLEPIRAPRRRLGFLAGQYEVPDDFDTMGSDEIVEMFHGRDG